MCGRFHFFLWLGDQEEIALHRSSKGGCFVPAYLLMNKVLYGATHIIVDPCGIGRFKGIDRGMY